MAPPGAQVRALPRFGGDAHQPGLRHWLRQDTALLHFLATPAAVHAYQVARREELDALNNRFDDIAAVGHVPWLDVQANGTFVLYQAPHGVIPEDLPRPRRIVVPPDSAGSALFVRHAAPNHSRGGWSSSARTVRSTVCAPRRFAAAGAGDAR